MLEERQDHQGGLRDQLLARARTALGAIEAARQRIDDLNVYPVPDGDTGTNLTLTVRSIVEALEQSQADDRKTLASDISRAALLGARGNSGVLLSQIVRGAAESFAESDDVARALRSASDAVYAAVRQPVEGTMLTLIRELAEEAEAGGDLDAIVVRGEDCVARTPDLMPLLREAGVVDSGAAGLLELVRGFAGLAPATVASPVSLRAVHLGDSRYRFCTNFVVEGEALDAEELERELDRFGDSVLVVGSDTALRAHVHTDTPDDAIAIGAARGTVEAIEVADMREQIAEREQRLSHPVVALAEGDGNRRLFESLGATVVDKLPAEAKGDDVIVLDYPMPASLSALVAYDAERSVDENREAMRAAAEAVESAAVEHGDEASMQAAAERLLAEPRSLLTILTGAEAPPLDGFLAWLHEIYPSLEVEVHEGGQPHYALLMGAE